MVSRELMVSPELMSPELIALLTDAERLAEIYGLRAYDAVQLAATTELHQARSTTAGDQTGVNPADQD